MGNATDCCSDGVLVPNNNSFPLANGSATMNSPMRNTIMTASSMTNATFGGAGSAYTPSNMPMPAIPPIVPPSTVMDAMSAQAIQSVIMDDGPYPKDGQFIQATPNLSTGNMKLPTFVEEVGRERGKPYGPFKFHKTRHTYFGEWKNHKFHGNGVLVFENGDYLVGSFTNGSPLGKCRLVLLSQGSFYEGQMRNWYADGEGVFRTANGSYTYRGTFHNSNADGNGIEETPTSKFVGIFSKATKVKGVLKMNGYSYDGDFQNNMFHGMGKLISPNGQYIGQFQNGKKWGHGMFRWNDGSFYEGDYANDMKNGRGRYVSADRSVVNDGEWRSGNFVTGGGPQLPPGAMPNVISGLSGIMNNNIPMSGQSMSIVQPFTPPNAMMPTIPSFQPRIIESKTVQETVTPGYINPSNYVPSTSSNYMPSAAQSVYRPPAGLPPVSMYNPGTLTPVSNYIPANMSVTPASQYNPGVMTGGSNMSFRGP